MDADSSNQRPMIGWREWLKLPELGVEAIKVKVDTGARSSALHAFDVECFQVGDKEMVRFKVHPLQRDSETTVSGIAELLGRRSVRSSAGHESMRPVIRTAIEFQGEQWLIELTLVRRDSMGFRMLLGREAVRGRFVVDPCRSYLGGRPPRRKRRKPRNSS